MARQPRPQRRSKPATGVRARRALTLLELIVVITILAALAGMVLPMLSGTTSQAVDVATRSTLAQVRETIVNRYFVDMNELPVPNASDSSRVSNVPQLYFLFVNPHKYSTSTPTYVPIVDRDPVTRIGWNGPYFSNQSFLYPDPSAKRPGDHQERTWSQFGFTNTYGLTGDVSVADSWGSPVVLCVDSRTIGTRTRVATYAVSAGANLKLDLTEWQFNNDGSLSMTTDGTNLVYRTDDLAVLVRSVWQ